MNLFLIHVILGNVLFFIIHVIRFFVLNFLEYSTISFRYPKFLWHMPNQDIFFVLEKAYIPNTTLRYSYKLI